MDKHFISAVEFVELYEKGALDQAQIIDVREFYEWQMYHLDEAVHIPMNIIPEKQQEISKEKPVYLVCAHGVRSGHVMNYLIQQGLSNVINVEGGMAEISYLIENK